MFAHQRIDLDSFFLPEGKVKKFSPPDEKINIPPMFSLAPVAPSLSFKFWTFSMFYDVLLIFFHIFLFRGLFISLLQLNSGIRIRYVYKSVHVCFFFQYVYNMMWIFETLDIEDLLIWRWFLHFPSWYSFSQEYIYHLDRK